MIDGGSKDAKILAVCVNDPFYKDIKHINQVSDHILKEIKHFFCVYKELEGKNTSVSEIQGPEVAMKVTQMCIDAYVKKFGVDPVLEYKKGE